VNNDFEGVMNGDPYHSILATMYAFGATGFDAGNALASMVKGATTVQSSKARYVERPGLTDYQTIGYLPRGRFREHGVVRGLPFHLAEGQRR
jgi:putative alpha-1,2-mannosidase